MYCVHLVEHCSRKRAFKSFDTHQNGIEREVVQRHLKKEVLYLVEAGKVGSTSPSDRSKKTKRCHQNIIRFCGTCLDPHQVVAALSMLMIDIQTNSQTGVLCEYAERGHLRQVLDANPDLQDKMRCRLAHGVVLGLAHLHAHSPRPILHQDLKPTSVK